MRNRGHIRISHAIEEWGKQVDRLADVWFSGKDWDKIKKVERRYRNEIISLIDESLIEEYVY